MYFLKTGSLAHLQWLQIFEPLMVITGIVQPLATIPSIFQVVFHAQPTCFRSIIDNLVRLCRRKSVVGHVRTAQSEARHLRRQHYRTGDEFTDGEWHPDECRMDLLRLYDERPIQRGEKPFAVRGKIAKDITGIAGVCLPLHEHLATRLEGGAAVAEIYSSVSQAECLRCLVLVARLGEHQDKFLCFLIAGVTA
jgi:hypothetical protein